ncbi:hypothetical protein [Planosporangium sp. 12N6]|uniref:hypothetical protein n=1 Tax=Planosporangium spinosum TaxID=3402278 RepID=UPI003CF6BAF7
MVEGLAQRICDGDVPRTPVSKRLIQLDLTSLVAGTRYRGGFEECLKNESSSMTFGWPPWLPRAAAERWPSRVFSRM